MMKILGASSVDFVAWRGFVYTLFLLHFVFICQFLFLQPLVSALGIFFYYNLFLYISYLFV